MTNLSSIARDYLNERIVCERYAKSVKRIAAACRFATSDGVNRYLRKRAATKSSMTVHHERTILLVLLRWAYETGRIDQLPRGIVKIKAVKPPTRCWTVEQCCTAVKRTFPLDSKRMKCGSSLGEFLRCWIMLGYETGARPGDLWKMRDSDFSGSTIQWTQNKTGVPVTKVLSPPCLLLCQKMLRRSPDGRVLGWVTDEMSARNLMRKYLRGIGLPGSSKWLRRSSATHIEAREPGKGKVHLGHRTPGMFERWYADFSQIQRDIPQAPALLKE